MTLKVLPIYLSEHIPTYYKSLPLLQRTRQSSSGAELLTTISDFTFTFYSTSPNCPFDPCIVFEPETLHHLLHHHLCSEPMDFMYYSIRRRDMPHGGERVGLMIDG